ncbi:uncharacterized protein LOC143150289 [Ptiloglossa arizonensis]|uniref:uncharacterized protein LOC143150289 n=1 Tax=Ptiloglossa arizonensis TaxID=3350558 RepID=UPI003F9F61CA
MTLKSKGYRHKAVKEGRIRKHEIRLASRFKNPGQSIRQLDQKLTVSELVYKYLRKVSYSEMVRKQQNSACHKFRRRNRRKKTIHPTRKYTNAENNFAKNYICDALSFAVNSGYLIPADRNGRILRLSSRLRLSHPFDEKQRI